MVMINNVEEDTREAQFVMARKGTTTDAAVESPPPGGVVGFHSAQVTLTKLVDESFELIPNVDVKPLIVNVR